MTVEASPPAQNCKPSANANSRLGKKLQANDTHDVGAVGSFSTTMSLIANSTVVDATSQDLQASGEHNFSVTNWPLAQADQTREAINNVAIPAASGGLNLVDEGTASTVSLIPMGLLPSVSIAIVETAPADLAVSDMALAALITVTTALPVTASQLVPTAKPADEPPNPQVMGSLAPRVDVKPGTKPTLLSTHTIVNRSVSGSLGAALTTPAPLSGGGVPSATDHTLAVQPASQAQVELREARLQQAVLRSLPLTDVSGLVASLANTNLSLKPQDRVVGRPLLAQSSTGFEGLLGNSVADKLGLSPTYEIAVASAVVPDTQVADTVSYWVTHGVKSAELTLDGLGAEPVQVHILLEGDLAQVDFRSNQADVRQVIEDTLAQLKEMLSSQGLQLTGMSVGTSGRETPQPEQRQTKPVAHQMKLPVGPLAGTSNRLSNSSVGQSLDMYV